jgi:hypothetical protein
MYWEPYVESKHGVIGQMRKTTAQQWKELFEAAARGPIVVRGAQRQTLHHAARRLGYIITANCLADADGYVVRASRAAQ